MSNFITNLMISSILVLVTISTKTYAAPITYVESSQIIVCPDGSMVSVWQSNVDDSSSIQTSMYDRNQWSTPEAISVAEQYSFNPKLIKDSQGNVVVGWLGLDINQAIYVLCVATKSFGDVWSVPVVLSSRDKQVQSFSFNSDTVAGTGTFSAIWTEIDNTTGDISILSSTYMVGGSWSPEVRIN